MSGPELELALVRHGVEIVKVGCCCAEATLDVGGGYAEDRTVGRGVSSIDAEGVESEVVVGGVNEGVVASKNLHERVDEAEGWIGLVADE